MKVHELIEELRKIPNQNLDVYFEPGWSDVGFVENVDVIELFPSGEVAVMLRE